MLEFRCRLCASTEFIESQEKIFSPLDRAQGLASKDMVSSFKQVIAGWALSSSFVVSVGLTVSRKNIEHQFGVVDSLFIRFLQGSTVSLPMHSVKDLWGPMILAKHIRA